ncbi:hypothetical protein JD969_17270 [Planctomycetota bacterium]|nr:hypothetical protein JD969_17270 [Planctomycetota bacterium]
MNEQHTDGLDHERVAVLEEGGSPEGGGMLWRVEDGIEGEDLHALREGNEWKGIVARWQAGFEQKASMRRLGEVKRETLGVLKMLFWSIFWPSKTTRRADDVSWVDVMILHVLGLGLYAVCLLTIGIYELFFVEYGGMFSYAVEWVIGQNSSNSMWNFRFEEWLSAGLSAVAGELCGVLFLVLMSSWCARPGEGMWVSIRRCVKRGLCLTGFSVLPLLIVALFEPMGDTVFGYMPRTNMFWNFVGVVIGGTVFVGMMLLPGLMLVKALGEGGRGWDWRTGEGMSDAWPLRCEGNDGGCGYRIVNVKEGESCPECGMDVMVSAARKQDMYLGDMERARTSSVWPLRCEGNDGACGYQLVDVNDGAVCPECGEDVSKSLVKMQNKQKGGGEKSAFKRLFESVVIGRGAWQAVFKPGKFGQGMNTLVPSSGGGLVMLGNMIKGSFLMLILVYVIAASTFLFEGGGPVDFEDLIIATTVVTFGTMIGCCVAGWCLFGILQLYVFVVGFFIRIAGGENRLYELQRLMSRQSLFATFSVPILASIAAVGLFVSLTFAFSSTRGMDTLSPVLFAVAGFGVLFAGIWQLVILILGVRGIRSLHGNE